jgi:hypothetical protein
MQTMRKHEWSSVGLLIVAGTLAVLGCRLGTPEGGRSREAGLAAVQQTLPENGVSRHSEDTSPPDAVPLDPRPHRASLRGDCHVSRGQPVRGDPAHVELVTGGAAQLDGQ